MMLMNTNQQTLTDESLDQLFSQLKMSEPNVLDSMLTESIIADVKQQHKKTRMVNITIQVGFALLALVLVGVLFPWSIIALPSSIVISPLTILYTIIALLGVAYYSWNFAEQWS